MKTSKAGLEKGIMDIEERMKEAESIWKADRGKRARDAEDRLKEAESILQNVLNTAPDIYWTYVKRRSHFPAIVPRGRYEYKQFRKKLVEKGAIRSGQGATRDPDVIYNKEAEEAYQYLIDLRIKLDLKVLVKKQKIPEELEPFRQLPIQMRINSYKQWKDSLWAAFMKKHNRHPENNKKLRKKAEDGLSGEKGPSPTDADCRTKIVSEFNKATKRYAKELTFLYGGN